MKPKKCICGGNVRIENRSPFMVVCESCGKSSLAWSTKELAIKNWNGGKGT